MERWCIWYKSDSEECSSDLGCSCKRSVFIECLFQLVMYCRKMWKIPTNYPFLLQKILEIRVLIFPETAYTVIYKKLYFINWSTTSNFVFYTIRYTFTEDQKAKTMVTDLFHRNILIKESYPIIGLKILTIWKGQRKLIITCY